MAAAVHSLPYVSLFKAARVARFVLDKHLHQGNIGKRSRFDVSSEETGQCKLCAVQDSQEHWLIYCSNNDGKNWRTSARHQLILLETGKSPKIRSYKPRPGSMVTRWTFGAIYGACGLPIRRRP